MTVPIPPVSWPVQYFRHGDTKEPLPAQVAQVADNDGWPIVTVAYRFPGGGDGSMRGVRHMDDPFLEERRGFRQDYGSWRFIPGFPLPESFKGKPVSPEQQIADDDRRSQGLAKVRELAESGLDVKEIAPKVRSYGLKLEDVEEVLAQPVG